MGSTRRIFPAIVAAAGILSGCQVPAQLDHFVHPSLLEPTGRSLPRSAVVVAGEVRVEAPARSSSSGTNEERTEASRRLLTEELAKHLRAGNVEVIEMPSLSEEQQSVLQDHLDLADAVSSVAVEMVAQTRLGWGVGRRWGERAQRLELTLGSGLAFLRERSGAEAAFVVEARTLESPDDLRFALGMTRDASVLTLAAYDLATGDLLWTCSRIATSDVYWHRTFDLSDPGAVAKCVGEMMRKYPGIEEYRELCAD